MSETATQPGSETSPAPGSDPAATGGDAGPAAPPAGYVPQSEAEAAREEARRARQAAEDLRQELARAKQTPPGKPSDAPADSGSDLDAWKQSILRDVTGVITLSQTAAQVKTEFPHADPALFDPARMSQFSSPEAFREAVEDSHRRVAASVEAALKVREEELRKELAEKYGDTGGDAGSGGTPPAGGDPTVDQILAMTDAELDALEAKSPGVLARVKAAAGA